MNRGFGSACSLPSVVFAFREMRHGFDVDVEALTRNRFAISLRGRTAVVSTHGWDYRLYGPQTRWSPTEVVEYVLRTLLHEKSPTEIRGMMLSMERYLVMPLSVPFATAKKFPADSLFYKSWLQRHYL